LTVIACARFRAATAVAPCDIAIFSSSVICATSWSSAVPDVWARAW
jgi:hypothetical protein